MSCRACDLTGTRSVRLGAELEVAVLPRDARDDGCSSWLERRTVRGVPGWWLMRSGWDGSLYAMQRFPTKVCPWCGRDLSEVAR